MSLPLSGVRVLDLTRLIPGAFCTLLLSDLGADVVKIESPDGGDYARTTPPLVEGMGAAFRATNRGKRSAIINLKNDLGQGVFRQLVSKADVLIESFRPGVMARLNCDYASLKEVNPGLIYCALSGWGQDGPYAQAGGHDLNYIAVGGFIGAMQTPALPGGQVADIGGAYAAVSAILAALFRRERTDEGAFIDISLFESALPFSTLAWTERVAGGMGDMLTGRLACYQIYTARDGKRVALAALEAKFWANFCNAIERPDLISYHEDAAKQAYLKTELAELFASRSAGEWSALLANADCCFSVVNEPHEVANDPHVQARGSLGVAAECAAWLRSPLRLDNAESVFHNIESPVPGYGEHTRDVLREAGFKDGEIDALRMAKVIG